MKGFMMGKRFDAAAVRAHCDAISDGFTAYASAIDQAQLSCVNFAENDTFTGMQAVATKELVGVAEIGVMDDILAVNDRIKVAQNDIMERFHTDVDRASNALIDEDTLDAINRALKSFYTSHDSIGTQVENIYNRIQIFSKYGIAFTEPDFSSGRSAFEAICGGDRTGGYITACVQKLSDFDGDATEALKCLNLEEQMSDLSSRMERSSLMMQAYQILSLSSYNHRVGAINLSRYKTGKKSDNDKNDGSLSRNAVSNRNESDVQLSLVTFEFDNIKEKASEWNIELGKSEWDTGDTLAYFIEKYITHSGDIFDKKADFITTYKNVIIDAANEYDIPPSLLAGVAYNEYGGDPMWIDDIAYGIRSFDWCGPDWVDENLTVTKNPQLTSFGNISIQVRRAEESLGFDPNTISSEEEQEVIASLKDPVHNIYIAAKHLSDLRNVDYEGISGEALNEEQIKIIATRYNRGPDLTLSEIEEDLSYADRMYDHMQEIEEVLKK